MTAAALQLSLAGSNARTAALPDNVAKARASAEEFEAIFLSTMLSEAFPKTEETPFTGGQAEDTWRGFMIDEYGKAIAKGGGLGIADHIQRELLAMQEASR